jgi:hypothetical protein
MPARLLLFFLCLVSSVLHAGTGAPASGPMLFAEVTALDISDDGLTYRLVGDIPATPDPLGRLLRTSGQAWTAALGFAEVKDAVDTGTGRLTAKGGHAVFANLGRQWEWRLPDFVSIRDWEPQLQAETGLHYASASLPAGGTHFQFLLSAGFEWRRPAREPQDGWAFGVRWLHYSNANLFTSNAGYDSVVFRLGRAWRW